jgi:hypothetical protein
MMLAMDKDFGMDDFFRPERDPFYNGGIPMPYTVAGIDLI